MIQTDEYWCEGGGHPLRKVKRRKFVRCPKCGRRLLLNDITFFGDFVCFGIPPHKIRKTKRKKRKK